MKTKHIISALLATAGLALGAHAATVPDLLIGFQQSGTPTNYETDLGSMGNFLNLAPNTLINLSGSISGSDLQGIFGSSALTGGTVTWAGVGTVGSVSLVGQPAFTTWVTQFDSIATGLAPSLTPPPSEFKGAGTALLHTRATDASGLYTEGGASPLSAPGSISIPTSSASSYTHWMASSTVNGFAAGFDAPTALSLSAGQYSVVDLFQYGSGTANPGSYIGSLELSSTGGLFFTNYVPTTAAIPEPTTYAALIGVAALGFALLRRKQATV